MDHVDNTATVSTRGTVTLLIYCNNDIYSLCVYQAWVMQSCTFMH